MRLVVVQALGLRARKGARMLYRQPAFLICSDHSMPLERLLQAYLWRWETDVAFREEKSLMGMGKAQVRTEAAVAGMPAFVAFAYALMHLAAAQASITSSGRLQPSGANHSQTPAPQPANCSPATERKPGDRHWAYILMTSCIQSARAKACKMRRLSWRVPSWVPADSQR